MSQEFVSSDIALLDMLRKGEGMKVSEIASALEVTATAVRQRLSRLMAQGYVARVADRQGRGRPSHTYRLTSIGRRKTGTNFADLAIALWEEIRAIKDPQVRRGLLRRLADRMAESYGWRVQGQTLYDKMNALAEIFEERRIPFVVEDGPDLPVLNVAACPYPELAERDRSVCAFERMMFAELLEADLTLSKCRLDGENCCTYEVASKS